MLGNYTKAIMAGVAFLVIAAAGIGAATQAGVNLGLSPVVLAWVTVGGGIIGTFLTWLSKNSNQPTLPPGSVVVRSIDVKPGSPILAAHKP